MSTDSYADLSARERLRTDHRQELLLVETGLPGFAECRRGGKAHKPPRYFSATASPIVRIYLTRTADAADMLRDSRNPQAADRDASRMDAEQKPPLTSPMAPAVWRPKVTDSATSVATHQAVPAQATPAPAPIATAAPAVPADDSSARRTPRKKAETTVPLYVRVPASVAKNLKLMALAEDCTQSDIVSRLLGEHVGQWVAPYRKSG